jgi:hypothetical protein
MLESDHINSKKMKKIKLTGKLVLNKETISELNEAQLKHVNGGAGTTGDNQDQYSDRFCNTNLTCPASNTFCETDYNCPTRYFCPPPKTQ